MNEKLQDRLDQLTIELKERRRNYRNSLRYMIYFCVIILVFFSLYSALIMPSGRVPFATGFFSVEEETAALTFLTV